MSRGGSVSRPRLFVSWHGGLYCKCVCLVRWTIKRPQRPLEGVPSDPPAPSPCMLTRYALFLPALAPLLALFNLGVANLRLGRLSDAQDAYEKLHTLTPHCPEVLYQLGHIAEGQGQASEAIRWFQVLLAELRARGKGMGKEKMLYQRDGRRGSNRGVEEGRWTSSSSLGLSSGSSLSSPSTPEAGSHTMMGGDLPPSTIDAVSGGMAAVDDEVLARLGRLYDAEGAEAQALHHFQESDRVNPFNLEVISWLGLWFARQEQVCAMEGGKGEDNRDRAVAPACCRGWRRAHGKRVGRRGGVCEA